MGRVKRMTIREPTQDDLEKVKKAYVLFIDLTNSHPDIEPNVWVSSLFSCIAGTFKDNNLTYEEFSTHVLDAVKFYKKWWDDDN